MELKGKVKVIGQTETFGSNGFRKRELVITTDEQYPQTILIEFVQDKCDLLDAVAVGQDVTVHINVRGREWVNPEGVAKYFNSLQGWKVDGGSVPAQSEQAPTGQGSGAKAGDDLPF